MDAPSLRRLVSLCCLLLLIACGAQGAPAAPPNTAAPGAASASPPAAGPQTINGVVLPPDAAPPEHQVLVLEYGSNLNITTLDWFESVYSRFNIMPGASDLFSDALVRTNKNYQIVPGAALSWSLDDSGRIWTFNLDPNLVWDDGEPVTADDYVASFRYAASPAHQWDFAWYYSGILKNWDEVVAGKQPPEALGVRAAGPHALQFETIEAAPYLPALMSVPAFQKKALERHGNGLYNTNPATSVSSGPFRLKTWVQGEYFVLEANPRYKGTNRPYIQKIIARKSGEESGFAAYAASEIDFLDSTRITQDERAGAQADPTLAAQIHLNYGDFRTFYLFYDMQQPPFDKLKVRQALSHAVNREALIADIIKPTGGIAAYSYLMPGFPAANPEAYRGIQNYDPALARQLLAEAGYPGGQGFPKLAMWLRKEPPDVLASAQAIAEGFRKELGIEVEVLNQERKDFADALAAKPTQIQFGLISYGMDYLDPYNMLSVWLSGGRHNWNNQAFDSQVRKAGSFTGDPAERVRLFQEAERMLVAEAAGVFVFHRTAADLYRPYLAGSELEPNDLGVAALYFPGYNSFTTLPGSLYVTREVLKYRAGPPKEPGEK